MNTLRTFEEFLDEGIVRFSEADVRFANELRYFRNGIVYYGKHMKSDYANKAIEFLESVYPKLKEILGIIHDDVDEGKNKP